MGKTVISKDGAFEWDEEKNFSNIEKHGISFEEAAEVFKDKNVLEIYDTKNSDANEDRYIAIGDVGELIIVVVAFTERTPRLRLITARYAESKEKEVYYANLKRTTE